VYGSRGVRVALDAGDAFPGDAVSDIRGELEPVIKGDPDPKSPAFSCPSNLRDSCTGGTLYFFGLLFLHLLIPNPTATSNPSTTSSTSVTHNGARTIWLTEPSGHSDPYEHLNGARDPDGQKVPAGHKISSLAFGQ
jgi:hypothetical protein